MNKCIAMVCAVKVSVLRTAAGSAKAPALMQQSRLVLVGSCRDFSGDLEFSGQNCKVERQNCVSELGGQGS